MSISAKTVKEKALNILAGRFSPCISLNMSYFFFGYMALVLWMNAAGSIVGHIAPGDYSPVTLIVRAAVSYLLFAFALIVLRVMLAGVSLFYLSLTSGSQMLPYSLFYGFRENFSRSFVISLGVFGPKALCALPFNVLYELYDKTKDEKLMIASIVSFIFALLGELYFSLRFNMSFFMMHDFPRLGAAGILRECSKKMKSRMGDLFRLYIQLVPYYFFGILSFGIGLLWTMPLVWESMAVFYLDMMKKEPVNSQE